MPDNHAFENCLIVEIDGPHGRHTCFVYQILGMSPAQVTGLFSDGVFTKNMLKTAVRNVLAALDFLHSETEVTQLITS